MHWLTRFIIDNLPRAYRIMAPVQWFGGKGRLVYKLLPLIPRGKVYVEPYGGAASVLFHRAPVALEVYNDLDEDLVNLFRTLQSPRRFKRLAHRITWTLYSRSEFARAVKTLQNPRASADARAWALFVAQNQGIGGLRKHTPSGWGRVITPSKSCKKTREWRSRIATLYWWHDRLTKVLIENRDALEVIQTWDSPDTVFYVDPPYPQHTRKTGGFLHEADDEHHKRLVSLLLSVEGAVILSGYNTPLYKPLTDAGWTRVSFKAYCSAYVIKRQKGKTKKRSPRIEVVWRNHQAVEMCKQEAAPQKS